MFFALSQLLFIADVFHPLYPYGSCQLYNKILLVDKGGGYSGKEPDIMDANQQDAGTVSQVSPGIHP